MKTTPLQKGNMLEKAVELIERTISKTNPSFKECSFAIEPKKILVIEDVRHEIDLFVEIDLGHGYKSVFIFECKNWEDSVGKNEIVLFSEKIKAVKAQKGYFVAKKFGKYALSQARLDPRIEILYAKHLPLDSSSFPDLHSVEIGKKHTDITFVRKELNQEDVGEVDLEASEAVLDGQNVDLKTYIDSLRDLIIIKRLKNEPTDTFPKGTYDYECEQVFDLKQGKLVLDGINTEKLELKVSFSITVVRPRIISKFDIKNRGRVIQFENIPMGKKRVMGMSMVGIYKQRSESK